MSVRETEKFVQKYSKSQAEGSPKKEEKPAQDAEIVEAEHRLTSALETKVKIVGNAEKGKITIDYFSKERGDSVRGREATGKGEEKEEDEEERLHPPLCFSS